MPESPKLSLLESAVYQFLRSDTTLMSLTDVTEAFPAAVADLKTAKGRVVISALGDIWEGAMISRSGIAPALQFACYAKAYGDARRIHEAVIDKLESWAGTDMTMVGQKLLSLDKVGQYGVDKETSTGLYFATVDYRFYVTKV